MKLYTEEEVTNIIRKPIDTEQIRDYILKLGECAIMIESVNRPLYIVVKATNDEVIYYTPINKSLGIMNDQWSDFLKELEMSGLTTLRIDALKSN